MNELRQGRSLTPKPSKRFFQTAARRCYTTSEAIVALNIARRTFFQLKAAGKLPLVELQPRLGRVVRYHAAPIDRYLSAKATGA